MTIKFRNPTKLGDSSASLLRHDGRVAEWIAKTCLYLLCWAFFLSLDIDGGVAPLAVESCVTSVYLDARPLETPFGTSVLVVVAVSVREAIATAARERGCRGNC
jgi:hypothetical protein